MKMVKHMVQQLAYEKRMFEVNHDHFRCELGVRSYCYAVVIVINNNNFFSTVICY
jgi:hypothetical protein